MQPPSRCLVLLTGIAGAGKRSHSSARRRATTRPSGRSSYQPSRSVTDRTIALAPRGIPLARDSIGVASVGARLLAGERARAVADEVGISLRTAERIRERALLARRRVSHSPHRLPFEERERIIVGIAPGGFQWADRPGANPDGPARSRRRSLNPDPRARLTTSVAMTT